MPTRCWIISVILCGKGIKVHTCIKNYMCHFGESERSELFCWSISPAPPHLVNIFLFIVCFLFLKTLMAVLRGYGWQCLGDCCATHCAITPAPKTNFEKNNISGQSSSSVGRVFVLHAAIPGPKSGILDSSFQSNWTNSWGKDLSTSEHLHVWPKSQKNILK